MSLLQRLQGEPEVLKEYDAVIKDQLSRGIVEIVDKEDVGEIGKVHYIPHHGVIRRVCDGDEEDRIQRVYVIQQAGKGY